METYETNWKKMLWFSRFLFVLPTCIDVDRHNIYCEKKRNKRTCSIGSVFSLWAIYERRCIVHRAHSRLSTLLDYTQTHDVNIFVWTTITKSCNKTYFTFIFSHSQIYNLHIKLIYKNRQSQIQLIKVGFFEAEANL